MQIININFRKENLRFVNSGFVKLSDEPVKTICFLATKCILQNLLNDLVKTISLLFENIFSLLHLFTHSSLCILSRSSQQKSIRFRTKTQKKELKWETFLAWHTITLGGNRGIP